MSRNSLAYRQAEKRTHDFRDESSQVMGDHANAMDCRDCEDFLRLGISAFYWLQRAETVLRESIYNGDRVEDHEVSEMLSILYDAWLAPAEVAKEWIAQLADMDYLPGNRDDFFAIYDNIVEIVEQRSWSSIAAQSRAMVDQDDW